MMLEIRNIYKPFDYVRVLNEVRLRLTNGFLNMLIGGNGSGKTTWSRMVPVTPIR